MVNLIIFGEQRLIHLEISVLIRFDAFIQQTDGDNHIFLQIEEKQYAKPFEGDGRTIYKIGVNFSSETRRLTEWKIA